MPRFDGNLLPLCPPQTLADGAPSGMAPRRRRADLGQADQTRRDVAAETAFTYISKSLSRMVNQDA